jgi:hypothetical protein
MASPRDIVDRLSLWFDFRGVGSWRGGRVGPVAPSNDDVGIVVEAVDVDVDVVVEAVDVSDVDLE